MVRAASAWDSTPAKVGFGGIGSSGNGNGTATGRHQARAKRRESYGGGGNGQGGRGNENEKPKKTPKSGGAGGFFGAGDWLAAAFTPRGPLAPDPEPPVRCVFGV